MLATVTGFADLPEALATVAELAATEPHLAADIYLTWAGQPADADAMAAELREILSAAELPGTLSRVTTTVVGRSSAAMHHIFTFRPSPAGLTEDWLIRGLHPG